MNGKRWAAVAELEFTTTLKRPLVWVLFLGAVFTVLTLSATAFLPQGSGSTGSARPFVNSAYALTSFFGLSGFVVYSFFVSILAGLAVIRDDEHRITELLHSTPLTPLEYIAGKFTGIVGAVGLVLGAQLVLVILFYEFGGAPKGPFSIVNYIVPALAFGFVPILVFACLAFAVGVWSRKPMVVYAIPVTIVFALPIFLTWSPPWLDPRVNSLLMVFDPSGLRWLLQNVIRAAPGVNFVNTRPVPFDSIFWLNRLGLLGLSLAALVSTVPYTRRVVARGGGGVAGATVWTRWFSLSRTAHGGGLQRESPQVHSDTAPRLSTLGMTRTTPSLGQSSLQVLRAEVRELFSQPALYLFIPLLLSMALDEGTSAYGPFGDRLILTAGSMSLGMLGTLTFLLCAILLFFTVESVHRERVTGFDAILYACPFHTSALLLGKNLASAVLVVVLLSVVGIVVLPQLALQDVGSVELWPFGLVWGLVLLPTLVLWNSFVTAVLSGVRERYTTYAICISVLLITINSLQNGRMTWAYNWTAVGTLRWSDMGTFDLNGSALLLNRLCVLALAVFFTAVAVKLFARVQPDPTASVRRLNPHALSAAALRMAPFAILPLLLAGVLAFKVQTGFQGDPALERDKAYWRQNVEQWADFEPPAIAHVDLVVEVEPRLRRVRVAGSYVVFNPTTGSIAEVPFTVRPAFGNVVWSLGGVTASSENRSGLHILRPATPLAPADSLTVGFSYEAHYPDGFTKNGGGVSQFVLPSGVVLHTLRNSFLPTPGFVEGIGITRDNYAEPAKFPEDFWEEEQRDPSGPYTARVEITAPNEYTMNSVGHKVVERIEGDRTTVIFESDHPVGVVNIVGGRWDVMREGSTAVFYHPGHAANAPEILSALVAARERYSEWFYPYPWKELRLSEYPNQDINAMGFPTNIPFSEGLGFLARSDAVVPTAFVVTAHEAAHQWWGNVLSAGSGPGTGHLVEGMATYSALLLLEVEHGERSRIEYALQMEASYQQSRDPDIELSLVRTVGDEGRGNRSVVFEKGAWVQWMLQELMGREQMKTGLQDFVNYYVEDGSKPVLQDMLRFLRPQAPDPGAFDFFVEQWFFEVVLPEFRISNASVTRVADGWEVSAIVENVGSGSVTVDVSASRGQRFVTRQEYESAITSVQLAPGQPTPVRWVVGFEAERITIDPDAVVLQRNRAEAEVVF